MKDLQTIQVIVREMEDDLTEGTITLSSYVDWSLFENNNKIDAYLNSKHTSGEIDSQGREKPFFNIVTSAKNIWYRATDIDRKDIKIRATKEVQKVLAFCATLLVQQWMCKANFGKFLNKWGITLAEYGSAVCKFVEKDGELISEVVPWNRMICDQIDFENNVQIEKVWMTPAQLRKNKLYDQEYVEEIIDKVNIARETLDDEKKDNKAGYIPIYEVHGELSKTYLTDDDEDNDVFEPQMHVVCFETHKEGGQEDRFDDFTLYRGKEKKSPYILTHLIEEDGRVQSRGAVENLFQAQWMQNHSAKLIKDQLDLASKIMFQTSDGNFIGQNAINSIENGQVLIHKINEPLTMINNKADIGALQASQEQWKSLGMEINGINEAMTQAPKSGTAWRQTQAVLAESHSLFELMTENKGLYLEEMFREFVIPYVKKKMDTTEEISGILTEQQIEKVDKMFVPAEVNKRVNQKKKDTILGGDIFNVEEEGLDNQVAETNIREGLNGMGEQRFIKPSDIPTKTWKTQLENFEWELEVDITGEQNDKEGALATLNTTLQTLASLQGQPMPPEMKVVFNKILNLATGINPVELPNTPPAPQALPQEQPQQPVQQPIT